jgi:hypothetical protein
MNLVEIVKGMIGDDLVHKLSPMIGASPDTTRTAVNAALPTMLAGLSSLAAGADGVRKLTSALETPGLGDLKHLTNMLGSDQESLVQKGIGLLTTLFGEGKLTAIVSALSSYLGLGSSAIKNLLAGLAPLILGAVIKQKQTQGLDAAGLANMLAGQKQNILSAMPAGLTSALSSVPGLDAITDTARAGYAAASQGVRTAADRARETTASPLRWLVPLALLLGLGYLLWNFYGRQPVPPKPTTPNATVTRTTPDTTPGTTTSASIDTAAKAPTIPPADAARLTGDLKDVFESATRTLSGIKDAATAQAALPDLEKLNTKLDAVKGLWDKLPAAAQGTVSALVKDNMGKLQELIDKIMALPGVGEKVKPVLDAMVSKLKTLTA